MMIEGVWLVEQEGRQIQFIDINILIIFYLYKWRPPRLSELTPMIFNTGLTHLGSEASIYTRKILSIYLYL